jgi:hypothetical protein
MTLKASANQQSTLTSFRSKDGLGPVHVPQLRRVSHSMSLKFGAGILGDSTATTEVYSSTLPLAPVLEETRLLSALTLHSESWTAAALDDEDDEEEEDEDEDDDDLDADDEDLDEDDDEDLEDEDYDEDSDDEDEDEDGYDDDDDADDEDEDEED